MKSIYKVTILAVIIFLMLLATFSCKSNNTNTVLTVSPVIMADTISVQVIEKKRLDSFPYYMDKMLDYHNRAQVAKMEYRYADGSKLKYKRMVDSNNKYFTLMQNLTK